MTAETHAPGFLNLARRLLYAWVRTQVPALPGEPAIDPARPVCYVIRDRRLSNVLVLLEESRRAGLPAADAPLALGTTPVPRSFFCLTRPARDAARERYEPSPLLRQLVGALRGDAALDVQLVPVTILWGRAPQQQGSILKALSAENWRPAGYIGQLAAVLFHGRQVLVRFGAPLALGGLVRESADEGRALRQVARLLRVHFRRQRELAIGPDLSHRRTQLEGLLAAPPVRQAISQEAAERGIAEGAARERARRLAREIASNYDHGAVRALELFLTWLWTRLYDGIAVHHFDAVARAAPGHGLVYVPCHRSHIDYLLLSYVLYTRGLTPPHIAAGANLNLPLIGPLLRRGGAFFLRRSFRGDALYGAVFNEYLHLLISRGFPVEYFLEGTRSRSGRMLPPRTGILGMTLKSFLRGSERPLLFVPVYIGYEKLIEGRSFLGELAGRPKSGESLWGLLGAVRQLRQDFGQVHVSFGEPLALAEFLERRRPAGTAPADAGWLREATADAAQELVRRINETAVVNPINLVALVLLATPRLAIDQESLERMIGHYQALLQEVPGAPRAVGCRLPAAEVIDRALRLGVLERIGHPLGDLFRVPADQAPLLAYFRNNVLHLVALPALLACLVARNPRLERQRVELSLARLRDMVAGELFLRPLAPGQPPDLERVLAVFAARRLLRIDGEELRAAEPSRGEHDDLALLGQAVAPVVQRHLLVLALLRQRGAGRLTRAELEESCHLLAQRLALLREANAPEFAERSLFPGLVGGWLAAGLLWQDDAGRLHFDERLTAPAADAELLLAADIRQAIERLAATAPAPAAPEGVDSRAS